MKKIIVSLFIISFIILTVFISLLFFLPKYYERDDMYIPYIVGLNINDAINEVSNLDYEIIYDYSNKHEDIVINTYPIEGSKVKKYGKIKIYVSKGLNSFNNYIGNYYNNVSDDIFLFSNEIGYEVIINYVDSKLEEGYIINQIVDTLNKTISIDVSINKELVDVLDFTGWNLLDVKKFEADNKMKFTYIYEYDICTDNYVISQSIKGRIQRNSKVIIYVAGIF